MATKKGQAPGVTSFNAFSALNIDSTGDTSEEEDSPITSPSPSSPQSHNVPLPTSKKGKAKRRALERARREKLAAAAQEEERKSKGSKSGANGSKVEGEGEGDGEGEENGPGSLDIERVPSSTDSDIKSVTFSDTTEIGPLDTIPTSTTNGHPVSSSPEPIQKESEEPEIVSDGDRAGAFDEFRQSDFAYPAENGQHHRRSGFNSIDSTGSSLMSSTASTTPSVSNYSSEDDEDFNEEERLVAEGYSRGWASGGLNGDGNGSGAFTFPGSGSSNQQQPSTSASALERHIQSQPSLAHKTSSSSLRSGTSSVATINPAGFAAGATGPAGSSRPTSPILSAPRSPPSTIRGKGSKLRGGDPWDRSAAAAAEANGENNSPNSTIAEEFDGADKVIHEKKGGGGGEKDKKQDNHGADHAPGSKWKSAMTRTLWTFVMIAGFVTLLLLGHAYMVVLVFACQAVVFSELSSLFDYGYKSSSHPSSHHHHHNGLTGGEIPETVLLAREMRDARKRAEREKWSKVMSWYFFATTNYFLYGETIIYYFKHVVLVDAYFIPFARHHRFISFMLYVIGFVGFVSNLKRNHLRRQFGLFCWIHMSLLLIVVSSHFIVNNILEGLIWFWVPASLVVMNDIAAYVFGMLFGRTQLIKLSPKKTVEGFVGAIFATVVFAYLWSTFFMRFDYMICPVKDLGTNAFSDVHCKPNHVFEWHEASLPRPVIVLLSNVFNRPITHIPYAPFQLHALVMAVFASLVAPFGGFFASGFKRAFNIKDFGASIPGHGGLTDRMDCQFLMGIFAYCYYTSLIREHHVTVGAVLQTITSSLGPAEQVELMKDLQRYLTGQGIKWN